MRNGGALTCFCFEEINGAYHLERQIEKLVCFMADPQISEDCTVVWYSIFSPCSYLILNREFLIDDIGLLVNLFP